MSYRNNTLQSELCFSSSMADTNSVLVSLSALNIHHQYQNTHLNPDAPEYIPILQHHATPTTSSAFFYYHHNHYPPPHPLPTLIHYAPPAVSYYFQPLVQLNPQTEFVLQVPPEQQLRWSQPRVDQVPHVSDRGRRRCGGRARSRGGRGVWRVKGGRSSTESSRKIIELESDRNRINRVTSSANESEKRNEEDLDSNSWRMVKYKSCKKIGKKYEIQPVDKSVEKTTVMIRNIPSRYTRDMMLTFLDRHCKEVNQKLKQSCSGDDNGCCLLSAYDFFYMPMDFKTGLNKSYAFVNFTTPQAVWRFHSKCDAQKWELFESNKIRQIALAKLQGSCELIKHFGRTAFACDCDEFLPVSFQPPRDGRADGDRVTSIIGQRVSRD